MDGGDLLYRKIEENSVELLLNRFSCRVVQKFVDIVSKKRIARLLGYLVGKEEIIVTDQNANHVIQRILERTTPDIYEHFFKGLVKSSNSGIRSICENKYGCRVVQKCLERVVDYYAKEGFGNWPLANGGNAISDCSLGQNYGHMKSENKYVILIVFMTKLTKYWFLNQQLYILSKRSIKW